MGVREDKANKTSMVDHLVVDCKDRIRHYGIHGVRGWNIDNPNEVQFRNLRGEDVEWEEIGEVKKRGRLWPERTRRWKRAGERRQKPKRMTTWILHMVESPTGRMTLPGGGKPPWGG